MCGYIADIECRYRRYVERELISGICGCDLGSGYRYLIGSYDDQLHIAYRLLQDIRHDCITYTCSYRRNAERLFWIYNEPEPQHERWCMVEQQCGCSISKPVGRSYGRNSR